MLKELIKLANHLDSNGLSKRSRLFRQNNKREYGN
jgi:hypothetical protein